MELRQTTSTVAVQPPPRFKCIVTRCTGHLEEIRTVHQDGTGLAAKVMKCSAQPDRHRYFLVGGRGPSPYNRVQRPRWAGRRTRR